MYKFGHEIFTCKVTKKTLVIKRLIRDVMIQKSLVELYFTLQFDLVGKPNKDVCVELDCKSRC